MLRSAKSTIDEMKPIIKKQGEEIERNREKDEIRKSMALKQLVIFLLLQNKIYFLQKQFLIPNMIYQEQLQNLNSI